MSEYKNIRGFKIQSLSSSPASSRYGGGAWASGGTMNTGRDAFCCDSMGTQTAALAAGGRTTVDIGNTESYNGTAWTEVNNLNTARSNGYGTGSSTVAFTGFGFAQPANITNTEVWNGTGWTEVNNGNTARRHGGAFGGTTDGIAAGGNSDVATTESWNGTNWTTVTSLNVGRSQLAGLGTSNTVGLCAGGGGPAPAGGPTAVEQWDGSSWTEIAELNTGRTSGAGSGPSTLGIVSGGNNVTPGIAVAVTELWNGTTWTELADLGTATGRMSASGGSGGAASAVAFGGYAAPTSVKVATSFEWTAPAVFTPTNQGQLFYASTPDDFNITAAPASGGAWASGGTMTDSRKQLAGDGIQTAAIAMGGTPASSTETYNGSAWTEVGDLNTGRCQLASSTQGSTTASLAFGGATNPDSPSSADDETELWNGTSWTEVGDLNTARRTPIGAGTTTAALAAGGQTSPTTYMNESEEYNGSVWAEGNNLNTGRNAASGCGTQTAALIVGGRIPASTNKTETYNGTSWTEVSACNTARNQGCTGIGLSTGALFVGGQPSPTFTEQWNGTAWTEVADLATGRSTGAGAGTGSLGLVGGGETTDVTEEWTVPVVNKTITVS